MKLVLRRDQKAGMGGIKFILDARADLSDEEQEWVRKYKMGGTLLYEKRKIVDRGSGLLGLASRIAFSAMNIRVTVNHLTFGTHIECKDIVEMCAVEEQIKDAAATFKAILDAAASFGGEEVVEV